MVHFHPLFLALAQNPVSLLPILNLSDTPDMEIDISRLDLELETLASQPHELLSAMTLSVDNLTIFPQADAPSRIPQVIRRLSTGRYTTLMVPAPESEQPLFDDYFNGIDAALHQFDIREKQLHMVARKYSVRPIAYRPSTFDCDAADMMIPDEKTVEVCAGQLVARLTSLPNYSSQRVLIYADALEVVPFLRLLYQK